MMDEMDCPEMPSFEPYDTEDRPPPPSIDDYPLGCEVDLVDVEPAKVAQTDEYWQPFMDTFFGTGRRTVRVVRHQGDYTFVVYDQDPEMIIGCTLYRACLSEPKVRFDKYLPQTKSGRHNMPMLHDLKGEDDGALFEMYTDIAEEDSLSESIAPMRRDEGLKEDVSTMKRLTVAPTATADRGWPNREAEKQTDDAQRIAQEKRDMRHCKYTYATKKAYDALVNNQFAVAVTYYTKAIKYSTDDGVRALSNRSVAYLGLRNVDASYKDAMRVIELTPTSFIGFVRAGNTLRFIKKFEKARSFYEEALTRDPSNMTLKYIYASNELAMLFASKSEYRRVASVVLDRNTMGAMLVAKKNLKAGETAWAETSCLITILGWPKLTAQRNTVSCVSSQPEVCMHCFRPLTKAENFAGALSGVSIEFIRKMYNDPHIVQCKEHCGFMYCSETCRSKAWAAHHWIECSTKGRWSEAHRQLPQIIEDFIVEWNNSLYLVHTGNDDSNQSSGNMSLFAGDSVDFIVACVRLACRMLSHCVNDGQSLPIAILMFDWVHPRKSSYSASLEEHASGTPNLILDKMLVPVYTALRRCFSSQEEQCLTFSFFMHCYERARLNCIKTRVSLWPSVQATAESYLGLLNLQNSRGPQGFDGRCASEIPSHIAQRTLDVRCKALERIVATHASSMPGYVECVGLFQALTAGFPADAHPRRESPGCNATTRPCIEQGAVVHVVAAEDIPKGARIVAGKSQSALVL